MSITLPSKILKSSNCSFPFYNKGQRLLERTHWGRRARAASIIVRQVLFEIAIISEVYGEENDFLIFFFQKYIRKPSTIWHHWTEAQQLPRNIESSYVIQVLMNLPWRSSFERQYSNRSKILKLSGECIVSTHKRNYKHIRNDRDTTFPVCQQYLIESFHYLLQSARID